LKEGCVLRCDHVVVAAGKITDFPPRQLPTWKRAQPRRQASGDLVSVLQHPTTAAAVVPQPRWWMFAWQRSLIKPFTVARELCISACIVTKRSEHIIRVCEAPLFTREHR
jgi:hypothetical protein